MNCLPTLCRLVSGSLLTGLFQALIWAKPGVTDTSRCFVWSRVWRRCWSSISALRGWTDVVIQEMTSREVRFDSCGKS